MEAGPDRDASVRSHFDRMTRAYLLTVLDDGVIEEHRLQPVGHHSEPLARLLAWCQRRPLSEQYAVKAEADGTFGIISMSGRRGMPPIRVGDESFATIEQARHGVLLRHIRDLTGT